MADINVVRKGPGVWPWIVAVAFVLLAIVWMNWDPGPWDDGDVAVVAVPSDRTAAATPGVDRASAESLPAAVTSFVDFADSPQSSEMGPAHAYVSTGIERLATALNAVAQPDAAREESLDRQLAAFREKADRVQANPESMQHANMVRDVFTSAVDVMAAVQAEHFAEASEVRSQIADLRQSAEAMEADKPLLDQKDRVTTFFDRAADTLRVLAGARRG